MPIDTPFFHEEQFRKQFKCPHCGMALHFKDHGSTPVCPHCGKLIHNGAFHFNSG